MGVVSSRLLRELRIVKVPYCCRGYKLGNAGSFLETEEGRAAVVSVTVAGRVGDPIHIGVASVYLFGRADSWVTGSAIPAVGGLLVGHRAKNKGFR